jgi:hypothetical protein
MVFSQKLNQHVQCEHFKMEGVPALRELIEKDDFICKIDLKDAYTVVPIHPHSRQYLTISTISHIQKRRQNLSVSLTSARLKRSTSSVLKTDQIRHRTIARKGYKTGALFRRHLPAIKYKRRLGENNSAGNYTFKIIGVHHQRRQKHTHTIPNTGIFGVPIQYQENKNHCTDTKDQQTHPKNQTSIVASPEIMPMDSESTGEGHINDTSNRRSTPTYSPSTARSSTILTQQQSQLGEEMHYITTESARTPMVEAVCSDKKWIADSGHTISNTKDHDLHKQLRDRLGNQLTNDQDIRVLERRGKNNINKRPRIESSLLRTETPCHKIRRLHNQDFHRQHDSHKIHHQIWRYSLIPTTRLSSEDSRHLQLVPTSSTLSTCSRGNQYECRQAITNEETTIRKDHSKEDVQPNTTTMGSVEDRRVCRFTQSSAKAILEPTTGSTNPSPRRLPTTVAEEGNVLEPTVETNTSSDPIVKC